MKIGAINSTEYMKDLRNVGHAQCPMCKEGTVHPVGDKNNAHVFVCDKCKFRINED